LEYLKLLVRNHKKKQAEIKYLRINVASPSWDSLISAYQGKNWRVPEPKQSQSGEATFPGSCGSLVIWNRCNKPILYNFQQRSRKSESYLKKGKTKDQGEKNLKQRVYTLTRVLHNRVTKGTRLDGWSSCWPFSHNA
jgi:hypothetical protein